MRTSTASVSRNHAAAAVLRNPETEPVVPKGRAQALYSRTAPSLISLAAILISSRSSGLVTYCLYALFRPNVLPLTCAPLDRLSPRAHTMNAAMNVTSCKRNFGSFHSHFVQVGDRGQSVWVLRRPQGLRGRKTQTLERRKGFFSCSGTRPA